MTSLKEHFSITEEKKATVKKHLGSADLRTRHFITSQLILVNRMLIININHDHDSWNTYKSITGGRPTIVCLHFIIRSDLQNGDDYYIHENKQYSFFRIKS